MGPLDTQDEACRFLAQQLHTTSDNGTINAKHVALSPKLPVSHVAPLQPHVHRPLPVPTTACEPPHAGTCALDDEQKEQDDEGSDWSPVDAPEADDESTSDDDSDSYVVANFTEEEIESTMERLLAAESKLADVQETLEEESRAKVRAEVREELENSKTGAELDRAVQEEMRIYVEQWEEQGSVLEDEIAILQERLEDANVDLPRLYKEIEKLAPEEGVTEVWRRRTHWAGLPAPIEAVQLLQQAEQHLKSERPVKIHRGKLIETGASGYLEKKISTPTLERDDGWSCFGQAAHGPLMGTKRWAAVYAATTPDEASRLGLNLPGQNKVEEIDDPDAFVDPLYVAALASERERGLNPSVNLKKVHEEDDVKRTMRSHRLASRKLGGSERRKRLPPTKHDGHPPVMGAVRLSSKGSEFVEASELGQTRTLPMKGSGDGVYVADEMVKDDDAATRKRNRFLLDIHGVAYEEHEINGALHVVGSEKELVASPESKRTRTTVVVIDSDGEREVEDYVWEFSPKLPLLRYSNADKSEKFACTGCGISLKKTEVQRHPILPVGVCKGCLQRYHNGPFTKGEDGSEGECRWCGDGGSMVCCENCDKSFCENCLRRNFGECELNRILKSEWKCFVCDSKPLKRLTESLVESEMEELSPSRVSRKSSYRRRNIKLIADDDEAMRQLYALEQERHETHVKRWHDNDVEEAKMEGGSVINCSRPEGEEVVRISQHFSKKLRPHQLEGVRFMWENCIESIESVKAGKPGRGCILAHCMGLGKTLQVITFLHTVLYDKRLKFRTALIIVPLNVLINWRKEFKKWQPPSGEMPCYKLDDVSREDARLRILHNWYERGGVLILAYSTFRAFVAGRVKEPHVQADFCKYLQDPGPEILVCDEAHIIKNDKAKITEALKVVKTQRRIALTGSPLQNNLMEYYCMVDFVRHGFLEGQTAFRNKYINPIENGQMNDSIVTDVKLMKYRAHILHRRLKGLVQRVDMSIVKEELPPKCVHIIGVRLSALQRQLYLKFLEIRNYKPGHEVLSHTLFLAYHALGKIWNHPDLLWASKEGKEPAVEELLEDDIEDMENDYDKFNPDLPGKAVGQRQGGKKACGEASSEAYSTQWFKDIYPMQNRGAENVSGKIIIIVRLLSMFSARGEKALVFSQSLITLDLIEKCMEKLPRDSGGFWRRGYEWYRFDGRTPVSARQDYVDRFNDGRNVEVQCMLISTKAGSLGMNITAANRVIMVDGSWNPTHDLQALFRVWRFGQTKPVYAYRLCANGTMEEKIYKRQVFKESLAARVLDEIQVGRHYRSLDLSDLFQLDDDDLSTGGVASSSSAPSSVAGGASSSKRGQPSGKDIAEDEVMKELFAELHPRWIARYYDHETLLEHLEDEQLSKEEEAHAWQIFSMLEARERAAEDTPSTPTPTPTPTSTPTPTPTPTRTALPAPQLHMPPLQHRHTIVTPIMTQLSTASPPPPPTPWPYFATLRTQQPTPQQMQPAAANGRHSPMSTGAVHYPPCSPLAHAKFFDIIRLKPGDHVMCDTCKQRVGWETLMRS